MDFPTINGQTKKDKIQRSVLYRVFVAFFILMVLLIAGRMYFYFNYKYYPVQGRSMQPTINPDPFVVTNGDVLQDGVFVECTHDIKVNDIIIIKLPVFKNTIIKRVIALEGDKISIAKHGDLNGEYRLSLIKKGSDKVERIEEDYIKSYMEWSAMDYYTFQGMNYQLDFYNNYLKSGEYTMVDGQLFYTLKKNEVFFMGDNRANSTDARVLGPCTINQVVGVVRVHIKDAYSLLKENKLELEKIKVIGSYFLDKINDYFAW